MTSKEAVGLFKMKLLINPQVKKLAEYHDKPCCDIVSQLWCRIQVKKVGLTFKVKIDFLDTTSGIKVEYKKDY